MPTEERPLRPARSPAAGMNWLLVILLILCTALMWRNRAGRSQPIVARGDLAADEKSTIELFKSRAPAVVHITSLAVQVDPFSLDEFAIPQGTGTGFIWDQHGYIVTNYHVIESARAAKVMLADRSEWAASLVGVAKDKDLAVLKIDAPEARLSPILIGDSADLQVGQKVFAIGNPFGLDQTLTTGIISGLGREIMSGTRRPIQGVIQTDAAINPGNSGGPLLDSSGRLIGVNTAVPAGISAGIGFAVPVDTVRQIVPQIIQHGEVERIGIGISVWPDHVTARLGARGVLVRDVVEGGPAEQSGVLPTRLVDKDYVPGDLIVAVNGKEVNNSVDLYRVLDQYKAGDVLTLTIVREGKTKTLEVPLKVLP